VEFPLVIEAMAREQPPILGSVVAERSTSLRESTREVTGTRQTRRIKGLSEGQRRSLNGHLVSAKRSRNLEI